MNQIIQELKETSHSDLHSLNIRLFSIQNPSYFFVSNFTWKRAVLGRDKYKIGVNPLIFEHQISEEALTGILAHELVHTEDYYSGSTLGTLLPIGVKVLLPKTRRQYERKTDLKTILKGHGNGLIAYKKFQYPLLGEADLVKKKREYLTPEEIQFAQNLPRNYLQDWIDNDSPENLGQMKLYESFKNIYGNYNKEPNREKGKYDLEISGKSDSFTITPVTCRGALKFTKQKELAPGKITVKLKRSICAYLISAGEDILMHEIN